MSVREISNDEDNRLLRTVCPSSGSVVTWRWARIVLLSAQGMDVPAIAQVTFTSADRVRDVIHRLNADGFDSLRPRYAGGRPPNVPRACHLGHAGGTPIGGVVPPDAGGVGGEQGQGLLAGPRVR